MTDPKQALVPPAFQEQAGRAELLPNAKVWCLTFLLFTTCRISTVQAADPYSEALDRRFPSLDSGIKKQVQEMAQGPEAGPPPEENNLDFVWGTIGLLAVILSLRKAIQILDRHGRPDQPVQLSEAELAAKSFAEQPEVAALSESLRADLFEQGTDGGEEDSGGMVSGQKANPVEMFFESAPPEIVKLQGLFREASGSEDAAARQRSFRELSKRLRSLCYSATQPELRAIWQLAGALEGLLKQLACSPSNVTPSVLKTTAAGLDILHDLCAAGGGLDFATDSPPSLLVVDDDPVSRFAISAALKKAFKEPQVAPDGETGLSLAGQQTYDVIFVDVEMPGMDGFELCNKIHQIPLNKKTPVVFVTQHSDFQSRAKGASIGGNDLIAKPFIAWELTVKALTLVLRSKLACRGSIAPSFNKASSSVPRPKRSVSGAGLPPRRGMPHDSDSLSAMGGRGIVPERTATAPDSARFGGLGVRASVSGSASNLKRGTAAQKTAGEAKPSPGDYANAFYRFAPTQMVQMLGQLRAASDAKDSTERQEQLGELFVAVHSLTSEAQRAELNTFRRLCSAVEILLRKLLERPDFCNPSTLEAMGEALRLLEDLSRARSEPTLNDPPIRILVVDDDPITRRGLAGAVQVVFDRPKMAENGEAALALLGETAFDLILMDVVMPGMDGFATCAKVRQTSANAGTPVVFVTCSNDEESRRQAVTAGGSGFIPKPFLAVEVTLTALTFAIRGRLERLKPSSLVESVPAERP